MNILQINTADRGGGAEGSAWNLFRRYREAGHRSMMAVGQRFSDDPDVVEIPRECPWPGRPVLALSNLLRKANRTVRGMYPLTRTLDRMASPKRLRQFLAGLDEDDFPGCRRILEHLPWTPDIIHCHNLHGWYFDLNALIPMAAAAPVILNLRDTWALTGHCAYFMDCTHWETGCGNCPNLRAYPPCLKDRTRDNLRRKTEILLKARVHLTAPSRWLADQAARSAIHDLDCTVIPNGIDTECFSPHDCAAARNALGLPLDSPVVMFVAAARRSVFKDTGTLQTAMELLAEQRHDVHFLCVGITPPHTPVKDRLHCTGYISSPSRMADCYRAADVFWHAAKAEAFGKTVTEAMACGTPVVASNVGGIPEQILSGKTGFLAATPDDFVRHTLTLLDTDSPQPFREAAARRGAQFSLDRQAAMFLDWYEQLIRNDHRRR